MGPVVLDLVCIRLNQFFLAHHRHFVKQARALRVSVFIVSICVRAQYVALLRFSLFGACLCRLCPLMDGMQTPPGITEGNQSYYTGNSFSVPHFAQQLQHGTPATPAQPPASIQEGNAPASSGVISSSLLSRSALSPQVTADPTRYGTGGVMLFAEAITQLPFLEFLQRCGVSIALPQPSRPRVSVSLLDAAVQTTPPCNISEEVSTQTSDQLDTLLCDVAVQTSFYGAPTLSLDAAAQTTSPSTFSRDVSTQMGSRPASSFSVDTSVQISTQSVVQLDAVTQLDLTEFLIGWIFSDSPIDRRHPFCQSPPSLLGAHVAPLPPPGLEQPAPSSVIATQSQSLTNASSSHCPTLQQTASTTHVGTHPVRPGGAKRSASTAYAGTHNSNVPCPRTEVAPFPKLNAVILPVINFGHSTTSGPSPIATADSDIMHHQFRLSLLQWNPGPARRNPTNIVSAACGKFHAVILQEASDHVPHISAYFLAHTDNTPFCSTKTPLSQTLLLPRLRSTLRAKILGAWCCSLSVLCFVVLLFLDHPQSHFARYISTMLWPRNVTLLPNFSNSFTPKCWNTRLIS